MVHDPSPPVNLKKKGMATGVATEMSEGLKTTAMETGMNKRFKTTAMHLNGLDSDLIILKVGPEENILTAHEDLLVQIPFFKAIFGRTDNNAQFQEAKDGCIVLPDDDPQAFADLVRYLYAGKSLQLPPFHACPAVDVLELRSLVKVYMLANKLGAETIENFALDSVARWCRLFMTDPMCIALLRANGLSDTNLYRLLIEELTFDIRKAARKRQAVGNFAWGDHIKEGIAAFSGQDCLRLIEFQSCEIETSAKSPSLRHKSNPCAWHVHQNTKPCPPGSKAKS